MNDQKRQELLRRVEQAGLEEGDLKLIRALFESYAYITDLIDDKNASITRLRKLLFGARTEKTAHVVRRDQPAPEVSAEPAPLPPQESEERKRGHGRNGADNYPGANRVKVPHESLQPGDPCPSCERGTAYALSRPGVLIRFIGQPPVAATIYELQKLRCNLCGQIFTAQAPPAAEGEKYDDTVASMVALLKYGTGQPFHRQDRLQKSLGVPLPASTQWEIVSAQAPALAPASDELIRQAAQGTLIHNDDTTVKILELVHAKEKKASGEEEPFPDSSERTGTFTSSIVATSAGHRIALFFSGRKHGGENLADVLRQHTAIFRHRSRCVMPSPAICRKNSQRSSPTAWRMAGGSLWTSVNASLTRPDMSWRRWRSCTATTHRHDSVRCRTKNAWPSTRPKAVR